MNLKSMNTVKKQNNLNINCTEEDKKYLGKSGNWSTLCCNEGVVGCVPAAWLPANFT